MKHSFCSTLLFTIIITGLLFISCTDKLADYRTVPVSPDKLLQLPEDLIFRQIWSIELPDVITLMAADLAGDNGPEIICGSLTDASILDISGRLLSSFRLEKGDTPVLLRDFDDDGKQDIIFHRPQGPRAGLRVFNGVGIELASFSPIIKGSKFARLTVESTDMEHLYLRLNTDNVSGHRGYMKLSFPELGPLWFFATPFIPEQLFTAKNIRNGEILLFPGWRTTYTGMYTVFGKEMIICCDLEPAFSFFPIDKNGEYCEQIQLEDSDGVLRGRIRYLKETDNGFILLHESDSFESEMFRLLTLDKSGKITDKTDFYPGIPEKWVNSGKGDLIILVKGNNGESFYYQISTSVIKGQLKLQVEQYTDPISLCPPYIITGILPDQFSKMNRFLFLNNPGLNMNRPDYLLAADEQAVSLYEVVNKYEEQIPDYSTNINIDYSDFQFTDEGPVCDIAEISEGLLHLRAVEDIGLKNAAIAEFHKKISRNSNIMFSIKFGEYFNSQHPLGRFKFLSQNFNNGIDFLVWNDRYEYSIPENGIHNYHQLKRFTFSTDQYYTFRYHLKSDVIDVYLNNILFSSVNYTNELPDPCILFFESHNEFWIKDFKVYID